MDPVSAVAQAVGDIFTSIGGVAQTNAEGDNLHQQWLNAAVPERQEFYQFEQRKDQTFILIAILSIVLIAILVAIIYLRRGKNN